MSAHQQKEAGLLPECGRAGQWQPCPHCSSGALPFPGLCSLHSSAQAWDEVGLGWAPTTPSTRLGSRGLGSSDQNGPHSQLEKLLETCCARWPRGLWWQRCSQELEIPPAPACCLPVTGEPGTRQRHPTLSLLCSSDGTLTTTDSWPLFICCPSSKITHQISAQGNLSLLAIPHLNSLQMK